MIQKKYVYELILFGFVGIGIWRAGWNQAQKIFAELGYYTLYNLPAPPGAFRYRVFSIWFEQFFVAILPFSYVTTTIALTAGLLVLSAFFLSRYLEKLGFTYSILGGLLFLVWYPMLTWEYMGTCDAMATALFFFAVWADDDRVTMLSAVLLGGIREFAVCFLVLFEFWRHKRKRAVASGILGLGLYFGIRALLDMMLGSQSVLLFPWYWRAERVGVFKAVFLIGVGVIPVMMLFVVSYITTDRKGIAGSWWVLFSATIILIIMAQPNEVRLFLPFWIFFAPAILNLIKAFLIEEIPCDFEEVTP